MKLACRPAGFADVMYVERNLRYEDLAEVRAARPEADPLRVLIEGVRASVAAFAATDGDGDAVALMGVQQDPNAPGRGLVWLVATPEAERYPLFVTKLSRLLMDRASPEFPLGFAALVWEGNRTHQRWLPLVGFSPSPVSAVAFPGGVFHWYQRNV